MISINRVVFGVLRALQEISRSTFYETFADSNAKLLNACYEKKVGQLLYEQALKVAVAFGKSSVWLGVWERI